MLKDASAAIYGARAGNGVILITTKRGTTGKPTISYHGNISFQNPTVLPNHVNSWEYAEMLREGELNFGLEPSFSPEDIQKYKDGNDPNYPNEDWYDAVFTNWVPMHQHNISLNGGNEQVKYFVSAGFMDQASLFKSGDWNFNRQNVRSNIDAKINDKLSVVFDLSYRIEERNQPDVELQEAYIQLGTAQPIWPATLPDPEIGGAYSGFSERSPAALTTKEFSGFVKDQREYINGKLGLDFELLKGLTAIAQLSFLVRHEFRKNQDKPFNVYSYDYDTQIYELKGIRGASSLSERFIKYRQLYPLISLEYIKSIGDHNFKGLVLAEWIDEFYRNTSTSRFNLLSHEIPYM